MSAPLLFYIYHVTDINHKKGRLSFLNILSLPLINIQ